MNEEMSVDSANYEFVYILVFVYLSYYFEKNYQEYYGSFNILKNLPKGLKIKSMGAGFLIFFIMFG